MAGYRFCRSDDVPLLVAAHNACWTPHFGPASAITVDDFKRGVRELGLWSSSCMVAFEDDEPIGVLLAAKRDGEANWIWRIAVKPGFERQGHGRHLVTSLAEKAAILGPPRLITDVPVAWTVACGFFERSGFAAESTYVDLVLDPSPAEPPRVGAEEAGLLVPVTLDELIEHGVLAAENPRAWSRSLASLRACGDALSGLAIATDRIEAYVLYRDARDGDGREIVAIGAASAHDDPRPFQLLLDRVRAGGQRLRVPLASERDPSVAALERLGFRRECACFAYVFVRG